MNIKETLDNLLYESVYDMKKIEEYYKHIDKGIGEMVNKEQLNLTKSFREKFPEITQSAQLYLNLVPYVKSNEGSKTEIQLPKAEYNNIIGNMNSKNRRSEKGTRMPTIIITIFVDRIKNPIKFKNVFIHEFVHALDKLRWYKKKRHIPEMKSVADTTNAMLKKNVSANEYLSYRKNVAEFNQAINMVAKYKDGVYSKITDIDGLVKWFFERSSGLKKKNEELLNLLKTDLEFRKRLLKRLARENLLPKGLKY
jgi:hypothetical protein